MNQNSSTDIRLHKVVVRGVGCQPLFLFIYLFIWNTFPVRSGGLNCTSFMAFVRMLRIFFLIYIKPFRALCHYNLVTGTNNKSYSNLNY